jgi:hypothetical protein
MKNRKFEEDFKYLARRSMETGLTAPAVTVTAVPAFNVLLNIQWRC